MPAVIDRPALELIATLVRRGREDLHAVSQLGRGESIDAHRLQGLTRAGLVRGGGRPHVPARLLIPALALDAALGLSGEQLVDELVKLLCAAPTPLARDLLLHSLQAELTVRIEELSQGQLPSEPARLQTALRSLQESLQCLSHTDADPAQVTRTAELCARLVTTLARRLTPRRAAKRTPALPELDIARLAAVLDDLVVRQTCPLRLPGAHALAAALDGPRARPVASVRSARLPNANANGRRDSARKALSTSDPLQSLYGGRNAQEALAHHAALIGLGAQELAACGWLPVAQLRKGPAPLLWSGKLAPRADARARAQVGRAA